MATRSTIQLNLKTWDKSINSILLYKHRDGYPSDTLKDICDAILLHNVKGDRDILWALYQQRKQDAAYPVPLTDRNNMGEEYLYTINVWMMQHADDMVDIDVTCEWEFTVHFQYLEWKRVMINRREYDKYMKSQE